MQRNRFIWGTITAVDEDVYFGERERERAVVG